MTLTLTIEKSPPGGEPVGSARTFESQRATLGRGQNNDWVLPDASAYLSRNHCEIVRENHSYIAIDTSQYGLFVNGASAPIGKGNRAVLEDGDRLSLGDYELSVRLDRPDQPPARIPSSPFGDSSPFPPLDSRLGIFHGPETEGASAVLDENDGPALPMPDHGAPEHAAIRMPGIGGNIIPDDVVWLDEGGQSPGVERPPAPPPQPDDGFNAFLGGARLKGTHLSGVDPIARLHEAGKTYRAAVEGVLEILKAREQFKEAIRIEKTMIGVTGNNPLKFSVDTEQALLTMIGGDRPGFALASAGMREALKDIKAHEMALVAAIQVALTGLLEQIAPETLKQRLEKRWLDGLVPGARKARIWEIYEATHAELARELADDFDRAFGKAFAEAYEEYLRAK